MDYERNKNAEQRGLLNQHNTRRDRFLLFAPLAGCMLWIVSVTPLRIYAKEINLFITRIFDVAPSFLAGATFTFWKACAVKSRPLVSITYAAALVSATEGVSPEILVSPETTSTITSN